MFAGILVGALFISLILGFLLAFGLYPIVLILVVVMVGPLLVIYPKFGLWVAIIGSLVVSGLIDLYLPSLKPLKWGLMLLSIGLALVAMGVAHLGINGRVTKTQNLTLLLWAFVFFVCAVFSSLVNWQGIAGVAVGLKGYFQVWGIFIAIYYLIDDEKDARRLIRFLLLLGLIQLPFILHQFFILVPMRSGLAAAEHGIVAVDVVAGTFGGEMMGGGRSPSLALLLIICLTIVLARWRVGLITTTRVLLLGVTLLIPIMLSEVKIVVVLMPLALFLLFRDQISRHPLKSLLGMLAFILLISSIFSIYLMLPGAKSQQKHSLVEMYQETVGYNFGERGYGNAVLNRKTVYTFWLKEHTHGDELVNAIIGHGPGATNSGSAVMNNTLATKRYARFGIDTTGISSLLWEVGLLGTAVALAMLYSAYRLGGRLSKNWEGTENWPLLKAAQISLPLFAVNLLHNNYFVEDLSFQALLVVILGYLLAMSRIERMPT
jgi:hypothetical protein